jgi:menaquinone-dependent protoporphyrinogen oxidase
MNILICYATTEGQTRKIAQAVAETLIKAGKKTALCDLAESGSLDARRYDAAILAGSVHIGRYQASLVHSIANWLDTLKTIPTGFISVSLSAASDDPKDQADAKACADRLFDETGWTPDLVHHAAGAFRYTRYDFFKRWAMRFIAMQKGAPADTSEDVEYTDWDALERFAGEFVDHAERTKATGR